MLMGFQEGVMAGSVCGGGGSGARARLSLPKGRSWDSRMTVETPLAKLEAS